jgi:hypothetical protein
VLRAPVVIPSQPASGLFRAFARRLIMAFAVRALVGDLTITPGSASGFAPWYASNCETSFRDAAGCAIFPAGEKIPRRHARIRPGRWLLILSGPPVHRSVDAAAMASGFRPGPGIGSGLPDR